MNRRRWFVLLLCAVMFFSMTAPAAAAGPKTAQGSSPTAAKITVKGTSLVSLNKKAAGMTVTWKKRTTKISGRHITGYQVQIASDKGFKKNRQTVDVEGYKSVKTTFKALKKNTRYYARVRTYLTSGKKVLYSKWSKVRSAKDAAEPVPKPTVPPQPDVTPTPAETPAPTATPLPGPSENHELVYHANDVKLADALYTKTGKNTITSPTSVNMVLSMLLSGAEGETKTELEKYLGVSKEELPAYVSAMMQGAFANGERTAAINNAFWYQPGQPVKASYFETLSSLYGAKSAELDFSDPANAAQVINGWCDETTKGLIKEIVSRDVLEGMSDVLLNTVYFKNHWAEPFEKDSAREGIFKDLNGQEIKVDYLHSDERIAYENEYATAFEKRYADKYTFIGILPKTEGDFTLEGLDLESLLKNRYTDYDDVFVRMPKFELESGDEITQILQGLGLQRSFTPGADFSGISPDLMLSAVVHKTKMILDENGTEAAAATAAMAKASSALTERKPIRIELTRPFAFLIMDRETGHVLFMGKITNPKG